MPAARMAVPTTKLKRKRSDMTCDRSAIIVNRGSRLAMRRWGGVPGIAVKGRDHGGGVDDQTRSTTS